LDPFCRPFVWEVKSEVNFDKLLQVVSEFVGKHDFKAFSNAGTDVASTVREIYGIEVERRGKLVNIWVLGDGFLKQMIRNLVGTSIDISSGKLQSNVKELLTSGVRTNSGRTAPALGLQLVEVLYETVPNLASYVSVYNQKSSMLIGGSE